MMVMLRIKGGEPPFAPTGLTPSLRSSRSCGATRPVHMLRRKSEAK